MAKTIVGLFDTFAQAQSVVDDLTQAGVERNDISVVSRDKNTGSGTTAATGDTTATDTTTADADDNASSAAEAAGAGAIGGTVLGGTLGLLVGIGALAIPGIGPVIAAGPIAAALGSAALGAGIGAAAGGLIGALVGAGVPEEDAHMYAEGVRRGGTLVTVNAADEIADNAYAIMQRAGAADIDTKAAGCVTKAGRALTTMPIRIMTRVLPLLALVPTLTISGRKAARSVRRAAHSQAQLRAQRLARSADLLAP